MNWTINRHDMPHEILAVRIYRYPGMRAILSVFQRALARCHSAAVILYTSGTKDELPVFLDYYFARGQATNERRGP